MYVMLSATVAQPMPLNCMWNGNKQMMVFGRQNFSVVYVLPTSVSVFFLNILCHEVRIFFHFLCFVFLLFFSHFFHFSVFYTKSPFNNLNTENWNTLEHAHCLMHKIIYTLPPNTMCLAFDTRDSIILKITVLCACSTQFQRKFNITIK